MTPKAIIAGTGIAGPLLAIQLKRHGYEVELYEARERDSAKEGVFLGLTPNGLNILKAFVPLDALKSESTLGSMYFYNSKGKEIGELPTDYQTDKYGIETLQVKRAHLNELIARAAEKEGITIRYGKRARGVTETKHHVEVSFEDGTTAQGDILLGCDGSFSMVRKAVAPAAKPTYTKNIGTGGFAFIPDLSNAATGIKMTFGERGFFAYAISNKGEVWWFNNYHREAEPTREEVSNLLKDEVKAYLLELHRNDDPLFSRIIKASHYVGVYPIYDVLKLEKWHTRRICLLGDAAHATSPHIGQGASLAIEDTVCLTNCLVESDSNEEAFARFQQIRQQRVEKIIRQARKVGDTKTKPHPVAVWFRDRMLKYFIKAEIRKLDWIYGYKIYISKARRSMEMSGKYNQKKVSGIPQT